MSKKFKRCPFQLIMPVNNLWHCQCYSAVVVLWWSSVLYNLYWPTDQWKLVKPSGTKSQLIMSVSTDTERSGDRLNKEERVLQLFGTMTQMGFGLSLALITVHRQLEISLKWNGGSDSWLIGWWACCGVDSRHSGNLYPWLLPRRISGLFWMASWAQETQDSRHCCFSSGLTRDKHIMLTTWLSVWLFK